MTGWQAEVERVMKASGVSRTELARRMGVSKSRVTHFLNDGVHVRLGTLRNIAKALGHEWRLDLIATAESSKRARVEHNTGRSTHRREGNELAKGSTVFEDWP